MAQHDYIISNQTFPNTRADINNLASAIATNNSGTSAPTTQYAGQFWIDTTSTTWTLYIHDGTDDIQFATIDTSANTVNFIDSALDVVTDTTPQLGGDLDLNSSDITGTGNINITGTVTATSFSGDGSSLTGVASDVVDDTTPQLGGMLDVNGNAIGNGTEELIKFSETASAVNEITVTNSATGNAPEISATGDDTDIDLKLTPKGSGNLNLNGLVFPNADGTTGQFLKTDGSGNLSFDDAGKIGQVQTTTTSSQVGANNQDTETFNFEASITPSSVTNQILVLCSVGSMSNGGAGRMASKLRWNTSSGGVTGTELTVGQTANDSVDTNGLSTITLIAQFTPATTSTIYIKNTISKLDGTTQWYAQRYSGNSYITLMEILN